MLVYKYRMYEHFGETIAAKVKLFGIENLASFDRGFRRFEWVGVIQW